MKTCYTHLGAPLVVGAVSAPVSEGKVRVALQGASDTDSYTNAPSSTNQQWLRDHFYRIYTFSTYWDSKLSWYPNAWCYADAYAIYDPLYPGQSGQPAVDFSMVLHDAAGGNPLWIPYGTPSGGHLPQYAADFGGTAWRNTYSARCSTLINTKGYKGIYMDDVNLSFKACNGSGVDVTPYDPRTGLTMTQPNWRKYFAEFVEQVRTTIPAAEIVHNPIWFASSDQGTTDPYTIREIQAANWVAVERGFVDGGLGGGTGTYSVHRLLSYMDGIHALGRSVYTQSYGTTATESEYNLAGHLLMSNGTDVVITKYQRFWDARWIGWDIDLGPATSSWSRRSDGLFSRSFTAGKVLLNEPGATTKTNEPLGGTYLNLAGASVTTVTLTATTGAVLRTP